MKPKNFSQALDELENLTGTDLRGKLESELADLQAKMDRLKDEARKGKDRVETQVKDNPWAALGIASLIFFVIGFIIGWRKSD